MSDLNTCQKSPSGKIITPRGKLFFANYIYEAQQDNNGKDKFSIQLVFKPDTDLKLLKNELGRLALEHYDGDQARAIKAVNDLFNDPTIPPKNGKPAPAEYRGWIKISAASKQRPDIMLANGKILESHEFAKECYSGRWARATLNPYFQTKNYPGLRIGFENVQLLDHDKVIGYMKPSGASEFGAVEIDEGAAPIVASTGVAQQVDSLFG